MAGSRKARRRARAGARPGRGGLLAVAAAVLLLIAGPAGVPARDNGNDDNERNEQRDTKSHHEQPTLSAIPLRTGSGRFDVRSLVLIQPRVVEVARTDSLGVDFESYDRLDVSSIPLLGDIFEAPLRAGDLTAENRVGTVYRAGDDSVAAVLDDGVDLSGVKLSLVNGKGRYNVNEGPRIVDIVPSSLGQFGTLPSVQTVIAGNAPQGTTLVLGGLTRSEVPQTADKIPVLSDVPVLQSLFLGTIHQREDKELIIFVRPSIITGDDDS